MSQDQQKFQALSPEDVISVSDIKMMGQIWATTTVTPEELRKKLAGIFGASKPENDSYEWFRNGVEGKALIVEKGGGWRVGRVRFSIEFLPDEPTQIETSTEETTIELDEFR